MRHSDINLTMQTYTHLGVYDLNSALEALPALPKPGADSDAPDFRLPLTCQKTDEVCAEMGGNDGVGNPGEAGPEKQKPPQTPSFEGVCGGLNGFEEKAAGETRTPDLRITSASLYQLSYSG